MWCITPGIESLVSVFYLLLVVLSSSSLSPSLSIIRPPVSSLQSHAFVDELIYEQNCLDTSLQTYPSRSPSTSSHHSSAGTCCGRRAKRNTALPNAGTPSSQSGPTRHGPLQELSAIHIQCSEAPSHPARWSSAAETHTGSVKHNIFHLEDQLNSVPLKIISSKPIPRHFGWRLKAEFHLICWNPLYVPIIINKSVMKSLMMGSVPVCHLPTCKV